MSTRGGIYISRKIEKRLQNYKKSVFAVTYIVLILLVAVTIVSNPVSALYIRMTVNITSEKVFYQNSTTISVSVIQSGDEAAYDIEVKPFESEEFNVTGSLSTEILEPDSIATKQFFSSQEYKQLLRQSDNKYLILNNGDEYYLEFKLPKDFVDYDKLEFVAEGYFIKHQKERNTIESPLTSIIIDKLGGGLCR